MAWTCPCGANNGDDRHSCQSCGYALYKPPVASQMSEDRREQLRAIRILAVIVAVVLISGIGLWILIRVLTSGPGEQPQTQHIGASVNGNTSSYPTVAPDPASDPAEIHTAPIQPALSADEFRELNQQRRYAADLLSTIEGILNTSSFAARAEIYCRFTVEQAEMLTTPGNISGKQMEERYRELLRSQPTTQKAELQREQQLSAVQEFVGIHRRNLEQCQSLVVNGMQRMPSDQELHNRAIQAQQQLAEIDQKLAPGASDSDKH